MKRAAAIAIVLAGAANSSLADCVDNQVELRGAWGQIRFDVEIADDANARALGLMHREELSRQAGMLFVYDTPQQVGFWMKNTLIPLDMLFIDKMGNVTRIHENAQPHDTTRIDGGRDIFAVLEINAGLVEKYGVTMGTEIKHPAFDQQLAVWPCSD